jgi:Mor family transcriptional regulator
MVAAKEPEGVTMDAVQELVEIARRMGIPPELASLLDREVRKQYGGEQIYIRQSPATDYDSIRAAAHQNRHDSQRYLKLSRQFGLSERRIRQIVDG